MLVIHPDECIDCGVCVPECPVDAIKPDTEPGLEKWLSVNAEFSKNWPNIVAKKEPPADAKEWESVLGKYEKYFSPDPGDSDIGTGVAAGAPHKALSIAGEDQDP